MITGPGKVSPRGTVRDSWDPCIRTPAKGRRMPQVSEAAPVPRTGTAVSLRPLAGLTTLTSIAIFCQALTAGQFVSQDGKDSWITVHGVIADISWVMALITAGYAFKTLRASRPRMVVWCAILFVITLAQT